MHFLMMVALLSLSLVATLCAQPSVYPGRLVLPFGDTSPTRSLLATADGLTIVSRHNFSTVVWDAATKHQLANFPTSPSAIVKFCPSDTCLLVVDGLRARIQHLDDETVIQETSLPNQAVDAEMSADGLSVAIAVGSALYRWDLQGNALLPAGNWKRRAIQAIGIAGNDVVSGSANGDLLLTAPNGQVLRETPSRRGGVLGVMSTPTFIAAAYQDGVDILTPSLEVVEELRFRAASVCAMAISPDGLLLGVATNSRLDIWNTRTWQIVRTVYASSFYTNTCALAFVSSRSFVAAFSGEPSEYPLEKPVSTFGSSVSEGGKPFFLDRPAPNNSVNAAFSPDGTRILTDHLMWDGRTGAVKSLVNRLGVETVCSVDRYRGWIAVRKSGGVEVENFEGRVRNAVPGSCSDFLPVSPTGQLLSIGDLPKSEKTVWHPNGSNVAIGHGSDIVKYEVNRRTSTAFAAGGNVTALSFSPNGRYLAVGTEEGGIEIWDYAKSKLTLRIQASTVWIGALNWIDDAGQLISGDRNGHVVVWTQAGAKVAEATAHSGDVFSLDFSKRDRFVLSPSSDGRVSVWRLDGSALRAVISLASFTSGVWLAVTPEGYFDTSDLEGMNFAYWKVGRGLRDMLPVEALMKGRFEPGVLARAFAGVRSMPAKTSKSSFDYIQPVIKILDSEIVYEYPQTLDVTLSLSMPKGHSLHDLKVFAQGWLAAKIDGQIIGKDDEVRTLSRKIRMQFRAIDPGGFGYVSAYAFNGDGIKSETDKKLAYFNRSPGRQRVTILSVGVNEYEDSRVRALKYAVADANILNQKLAASVAKAHPDAQVDAQVMISDGINNLATKAAFVAKLRSLAARRSEDGNSNSDVRANDALIVTFAGHGYYQPGGVFSLMFADSQVDPAGVPINALTVSELSTLLEDIFVGEITVIVDACHSASPISTSDIPPSPLSGRGFAQMAYTKRIQYLGSSQATQLAMESPKLGHGFLSYALAIEGLEGRMADHRPADGVIGLTELLEFAAARVPLMTRGQLVQGRPIWVGEGDKAFMPTWGTYGPQKPSLFNLTRGARDFVIDLK